MSKTAREERTALRDRQRLAREVVTLQQQLTLAEERSSRSEAERRTDQEQDQLRNRVRQLQEQLEANQGAKMQAVLARAFVGDHFPTFGGDPHSDVPVETFLADYELACATYGIEEDKRAKYLSSRLRGHALKVYKEEVKTTPTRGENYAELKQWLMAYFQELFGGRRTGTTNFYSRAQREGESVFTYFNALKLLAKHAYPGEEEMPSAQFLERFIRGLRPGLKAKILAKDVRTATDTLKAAVMA